MALVITTIENEVYDPGSIVNPAVHAFNPATTKFSITGLGTEFEYPRGQVAAIRWVCLPFAPTADVDTCRKYFPISQELSLRAAPEIKSTLIGQSPVLDVQGSHLLIWADSPLPVPALEPYLFIYITEVP